jgi:tetratricopeptide (TPR) repeat protein
LVVGHGGPPLGEDGRLTSSLREARALQELGSGLRIVAEAELLERLGLEERSEELGRLYTTEQLSRILDVPARTIRAWVRHGLIEPARVVRRLCLFEFRQVASARALSRLTRAGVTPARIRESLERLGLWLGQGERALSQLETLESSRLLVVRTPEGLAEPDGQLRLDFGEQGPEAPGAPGAPGAGAAGEPAGRWSRRASALAPDPFELGAEAEEDGRLEDAAEAYERGLQAGAKRPELYFNLGNVYYSLDRKADAAKALLSAVELDGEYVEAWNNLGNIMADVGEVEEAEGCFLRALELEPGYADAHYNLAEVLADRDDYRGARQHWTAYLAADPFSSTAEVVRERLRRTN